MLLEIEGRIWKLYDSLPQSRVKKKTAGSRGLATKKDTGLSHQRAKTAKAIAQHPEAVKAFIKEGWRSRQGKRGGPGWMRPRPPKRKMGGHRLPYYGFRDRRKSPGSHAALLIASAKWSPARSTTRTGPRGSAHPDSPLRGRVTVTRLASEAHDHSRQFRLPRGAHGDHEGQAAEPDLRQQRHGEPPGNGRDPRRYPEAAADRAGDGQQADEVLLPREAPWLSRLLTTGAALQRDRRPLGLSGRLAHPHRPAGGAARGMTEMMTDRASSAEVDRFGMTSQRLLRPPGVRENSAADRDQVHEPAGQYRFRLIGHSDAPTPITGIPTERFTSMPRWSRSAWGLPSGAILGTLPIPFVTWRS